MLPSTRQAPKPPKSKRFGNKRKNLCLNDALQKEEEKKEDSLCKWSCLTVVQCDILWCSLAVPSVLPEVRWGTTHIQTCIHACTKTSVRNHWKDTRRRVKLRTLFILQPVLWHGATLCPTSISSTEDAHQYSFLPYCFGVHLSYIYVFYVFCDNVAIMYSLLKP